MYLRKRRNLVRGSMLNNDTLTKQKQKENDLDTQKLKELAR